MNLSSLKQICYDLNRQIGTHPNLSELTLNNIIKTVIWDVAKYMNTINHPYFVELKEFTILDGEVVLMTTEMRPITEMIDKLAYAYVINGEERLELQVTSLENVLKANYSNSEYGYITYSKSRLFIHIPPKYYNSTMYLAYYSFPEMPIEDEDEIDLPVDMMEYFFILFKIYLYGENPIPRELLQLKYEFELKNKFESK